MKRIIGVLIASISLLDGFRGRRHEGRCKFSYRTGASEMPSPFCLAPVFMYISCSVQAFPVF